MKNKVLYLLIAGTLLAGACTSTGPTSDERETAQERLEAQLAELEGWIAQLEERAAEAEANFQVELDRTVESLKSQKATLRIKLDEMKEMSPDAWDKVRSETEEAFDKLRREYEEVRDRLS